MLTMIKSPKSTISAKLLLKLSSPRWLTDSEFNSTVCGRSLPSTIHVLAMRILLPSLLYAPGMQNKKMFLKSHINSAITRIYPLQRYHKCLDIKVNISIKVDKKILQHLKEFCTSYNPLSRDLQLLW